MALHHLPLDEETSELCSMSLLFGTSKHARLPQGIVPVVVFFQRDMSHLFSDHDTLMHSNNNEQDNMEKITIATKRLQDHNLKVKVSRFKFLQKKVPFLRYEITDVSKCL